MTEAYARDMTNTDALSQHVSALRDYGATTLDWTLLQTSKIRTIADFERFADSGLSLHLYCPGIGPARAERIIRAVGKFWEASMQCRKFIERGGLT